MSSIFDRLAAGPAGIQQSDYQDWNQMVGPMPPDQFAQHATSAMQQVDPGDYYHHTQPGVGGTDPFGALAPHERSGLAQSLIGALTGSGVSQQAISQGTGIGQIDPRTMSPQQLAGMAQWMQQNHPGALGQAASQYQQQPGMVSSLLGNHAVMGLGASLGASYLANRMGRG